jgi:hypothetical protein
MEVVTASLKDSVLSYVGSYGQNLSKTQTLRIYLFGGNRSLAKPWHLKVDKILEGFCRALELQDLLHQKRLLKAFVVCMEIEHIQVQLKSRVFLEGSMGQSPFYSQALPMYLVLDGSLEWPIRLLKVALSIWKRWYIPVE